jgi:hypothetical protein
MNEYDLRRIFEKLNAIADRLSRLECELKEVKKILDSVSEGCDNVLAEWNEPITVDKIIDVEE